MKKIYLTMACLAAFAWLSAQSPGAMVTSWKLNTTGDLYNGDSTDIMEVWYTNTNVYIRANAIASYYGGLTHTSVFSASPQDYIMELPRSPQPATNPEENSGFCGIWLNGTYAGAPGDGRYYDPNSTGLTEYARVAWFFEGVLFVGPNPTNSPYGDMDETFGHSTPGGLYHYHVLNNAMLANYQDSTQHSELIGFAYDGYPIYGPWGYSDPTDATSPIARMTSSYQERNISNRNTLPDGSTSTNPPPINSSYPVGCFIEDYEYVANSGLLDEHNGRFAVTPEFPSGTYAYFVTLDDTLGPDYPYILGDTHYGELQYTGAGPTVNSIPASAVQYTGSATGIADLFIRPDYQLYPQPAGERVYLNSQQAGTRTVELYNLSGQRLLQLESSKPLEEINLRAFPQGTYVVKVREHDTNKTWSHKLIHR